MRWTDKLARVLAYAGMICALYLLCGSYIFFVDDRRLLQDRMEARQIVGDHGDHRCAGLLRFGRPVARRAGSAGTGVDLDGGCLRTRAGAVVDGRGEPEPDAVSRCRACLSW